MAAVDYYQDAEAVTPHNTNPLSRPAQGLFIGGAGTLACRTENGSADTAFATIPAGTTLRLAVTHVRASGTSATGIVALFA